MSIVSTIVEAAAKIAEGVILAAAVYLTNRGIHHSSKRDWK